MNNYTNFDQILLHAGDDWGDDGVLRAVEFLRAFTAQDWTRLSEALHEKPEVWQCLCADALIDADEDRAIPLLLAFIREGTNSVQIHSCDSLRVLLQTRSDPLKVDKEVVLVVRRLLESSSGILGQSLGKLITTLSPDG